MPALKTLVGESVGGGGGGEGEGGCGLGPFRGVSHTNALFRSPRGVRLEQEGKIERKDTRKRAEMKTE